MNKSKFFNLKTLISFIAVLTILSLSFVVVACPNLEKDIKKDISKYMSYLNNGEVSEYYSLYNTRKLSDIDKSLFYDKIRNTVKVINAEKETFMKYRMKVKVDKVDILEKMNTNLYLCNLKVTYQIRENINTTKTIKKTEEYIVKVLHTQNDGYKILLPFNSLNKDFSETETFSSIEQIYKNKKAKEIENKRKKDEKEKDEDTSINTKNENNDNFEDENGLDVDKNTENEDKNAEPKKEVEVENSTSNTDDESKSDKESDEKSDSNKDEQLEDSKEKSDSTSIEA